MRVCRSPPLGRARFCAVTASPRSLRISSQTFLHTTAPAAAVAAEDRVAGQLMKLLASGLLMSNAKLFHHVLGIAQMVLE